MLLPNDFKEGIFLPSNRWENRGSESLRNYPSHCSRCCQCFADVAPLTMLCTDSVCFHSQHPAPSTHVSAGCPWLLEPPWPALGELIVSRNLHSPVVSPYPPTEGSCGQLETLLPEGAETDTPPTTHPPHHVTVLDIASLLVFFALLSHFPTLLSVSPWNIF